MSSPWVCKWTMNNVQGCSELASGDFTSLLLGTLCWYHHSFSSLAWLQDGIIRSLGEKLGLAETASEVISMKAGKIWETGSCKWLPVAAIGWGFHEYLEVTRRKL